MSQRFGRNQRRRARETIAATQLALENEKHARVMAEGLGLHLNRRVSELSGVLEEAADIAGRMSVLFPAEDVNSQHKSNTYRVPLRRLSSVLDTIGDGAPGTFSVIDLPVMLTKVSRDALDRAVHVRVSYGDKTAGYALSEQAARMMTRDQLERRIAPEIAHHLARQFGEARQEGGGRE